MKSDTVVLGLSLFLLWVGEEEKVVKLPFDETKPAIPTRGSQ